MKTSFTRKYISTVCAAALLAGIASPLSAAEGGSSSIEINLEVLSTLNKPAVEPVKKESKKEAPKPAAKKKPAAEKAEKPKKPAPAKKAEPKPAKVENAPVAAPAPVAEIKEAPKVPELPATEPAPQPKAPEVKVPETKPVELPPIKDLPPELTPAPPEVSPPPAATAKPPAEAPKTPDLPIPAAPVVPAAPEAVTPPELPTATPAEPITPPETLPTPAAPEVPKVEEPKKGLGDQLSDFISGKPSDTPPELPPVEPAVPLSEAPPELPSVPPAAMDTPPTTAMGSPLPDSSLSASPPSEKPKEAVANNLPKPSAPIVPAEPAAPAPGGLATPPSLPTLTPAPPAEAKTSEEKAAPELPTPELPTPSVEAPPALPPISELKEEKKPAPTADASTPPPLAGLPSEDNMAFEGSKTAEIPDLVPLPDDAKEALPSLPSGNQEDLLSSTPQASASGSKALMEELSKKSSTAGEPDMRLIFSESETDVSPSLHGQLDSVAAKLAQSPNARVNILSYAGGKNESGIYPKRVSLARGIAVRNYLTTTKGIDIERVNVRALGNKSEGAAPDRVDIIIVK